MPLGLDLLASAGMSAVNSLFDMGKGRRQRKFAREMWDKQVEQQDKVNAQAMAYQDKVNQENRDWNTEKNVRQRIEDAGYNPFLYGQGASGAGISSAANLGNSVSAPSPTPIESDAPDIGGALSNFAQVYQGIVGAAAQSYDLDRRKIIDNNTDADFGKKGGAQSEEKKAQVLNARNVANISAVDSFQKQLTQSILESPALDENDQPILDPLTGNGMTVGQAQGREEFKQLLKNTDKLCEEVSNLVKQGKNLDVDLLTKKYNLDNILPEQLLQIKTAIRELKSRVASNYASAQASLASADDSRSHVGVNNAQKEFLKEQKNLSKSQRQKVDSETIGQIIDNDINDSSKQSIISKRYAERYGSGWLGLNQTVGGIHSLFESSPQLVRFKKKFNASRGMSRESVVNRNRYFKLKSRKK